MAPSEKREFSLSEFWRAPRADLPAALDEELWGWVERIFFQFRDLELFLGCEATLTHVAADRSSRLRVTQRQRDAWPLDGDSRRGPKSTAMNQRSIDVAERVLEFAPKKKGRFEGDSLEQSGLAIVAMLQEAADLSNDTCERAEALADELSRALRAAEDRINRLEAEIEHFHDRAAHAESWLQLIRKEIDEKLIAPMAATRPKSMI